MNCQNCGNEIEDGKVYCEKCGKPVQIVPDYDAFSNEIIPSIVAHPEEKLLEKIEKPLENEGRTKKKKFSGLVTAATFLALLFCALIVLFGARYFMSYEYKKGQADDAFSHGEFEDAIVLYLDAMALKDEMKDAEKTGIFLAVASSYRSLGDNKASVNYYNKVLELSPDNDEAFKALTDIYVKAEDYDSLSSLRTRAGNTSQKSMIENAYAGEVLFSLDEGEYDDDIMLSLSSPKGASIYYTINGGEPSTTDGTLYKEPVQLLDGKSLIRARAISDTGVLGPVVAKEYNVSYKAPELPVIIPDGGNYFEPVSAELRSNAEGAEIYFTWDGSAPDRNSSKYEAPITVPEGNNVLSVIVIDKHGLFSQVQRANFIYTPVEKSATSEADN